MEIQAGIGLSSMLSFMGNHHHRDTYRSVVARLPSGLPDGVHLVVWDWAFLEPRQMVYQRFPWEEWLSIAASTPDLTPVLLIDSMNESPQYQSHLAPLVGQLCDGGFTARDLIIHCTGGLDEVQAVAKLPSRGAFCLGYQQVQDPMPWRHHFVMLARVPKPLRVMCAVGLLEAGLDAHGYASCGVNTHGQDRSWIDAFVPYELRHRFPLSIDDAVIADMSTKQFDVSDSRIAAAAIHLIPETSQDDCLVSRDAWCTWADTFITEKTAKAFWLCQLPLWVAVPGTVAAVRRMGFDVFDDIIDHGYDGERDPTMRVDMVIDQLRALCAIDMDDLANLRTTLWPRLQANRARCHAAVAAMETDMAMDLQMILNGMAASIGNQR